MSIEIDFSKSVIQRVTFGGSDFWVKRDDLIHPDFSGNKARKFYYFLNNDFSNIKKLISRGSSQSNAMYSMSVLAKAKGWEFWYFTDHISNTLRQNPDGNYKAAIENGMQIVEGNIDCTNLDEYSLYIKEGGAQWQAEVGIKLLADEIKEWAKEQALEDIKVFLPSGTGATALFLQKNLDFEVLTCPCVGDGDYLKKQFFDLQKDEKEHPTILLPEKKYHFGKLYNENYAIWQKLLHETNIEFDLLYDPIGWQVGLKYQKENPKAKILYIHQGGLIGNITMKQRYDRRLAN